MPTRRRSIRAGLAVIAAIGVNAPATAGAEPVNMRPAEASDLEVAEAQQSYYTSYGTIGEPVTVPAIAADSFDWDDAAIGAGGVLGLIVITAGTRMATGHRRLERSLA